MTGIYTYRLEQGLYLSCGRGLSQEVTPVGHCRRRVLARIGKSDKLRTGGNLEGDNTICNGMRWQESRSTVERVGWGLDGPLDASES
jgi:hypothetical protein